MPTLLSQNFDIIALGETWLSTNDNLNIFYLDINLAIKIVNTEEVLEWQLLLKIILNLI